LAVLRRDGKLVAYAAPTGWRDILSGLIKLTLTNLFSRKSAEFYGITALYMRDKQPFMEDLAQLFSLLEQGKIKPIIAARLPLLEARQANEILESGQVTGNIVLLAPDPEQKLLE
jgi:NADPH:quinone reductase-like Zn-dependent oxidoreductase